MIGIFRIKLGPCYVPEPPLLHITLFKNDSKQKISSENGAERKDRDLDKLGGCPQGYTTV